MACMRIAAFILRVLLATVFVASSPSTFALNFTLELQRVDEANASPATYYSMQVAFGATAGEFDEFVDEYVLRSPDLSITLSSTESNNSSGRADLETFAELTNALYGTWIIEERLIGFTLGTRQFTITPSGLVATDLSGATVLSPSNGAVVSSFRPIIQLQGPAGFTAMELMLSPDSGLYPAGITNFAPPTSQWTPTFILNAGHHNLSVNYSRQLAPGEKISVSNPGGPWSANTSLHSQVRSTFTVSPVGFIITGPERLAGNQLRWSFPTQTGATYVVQANPSLTTTNWTSIQTNSGNGSPQSFTINANAPARYFRFLIR